MAYEPRVEPTLRVGRARMRLVSEREPKRLPWKTLGVDIVIEATVALATFDQARARSRLKHTVAAREHVRQRITAELDSIIDTALQRAKGLSYLSHVTPRPASSFASRATLASLPIRSHCADRPVAKIPTVLDEIFCGCA